MEVVKLCVCGCGGEVKKWKNGVSSPFLRGHHMRKPNGYQPEKHQIKYCKCGCGTVIPPYKNGHIPDYVKGHHLKGSKLTLEYRMERTKSRWGKEPVLSPYLDCVFIKFSEKNGRWNACVKREGIKSRNILHAKAVYLQYHGEIPEGYVVHHKNGRCDRIEDDRPENLMLLPDEWNLRFFPVLAKGFGFDESQVTDTYLELNKDGKSDNELFSELCSVLIEKRQYNGHCC